ncbi:hypothetical protein Saso_21250 [Streptomyces asoensis]|uniref:Uncharacterized protein n=1 Tax=Streptomyces asoensis TaxID=249586 RepID=A0ABQ3RX78_9ACTN|nr:hypothetical protein GCM10010496_13840 [Streptomyces asoensis]GHI60475.1 hypothetical protein Saso_21250 [Streptomyces asoensis]
MATAMHLSSQLVAEVPEARSPLFSSGVPGVDAVLSGEAGPLSGRAGPLPTAAGPPSARRGQAGASAARHTAVRPPRPLRVVAV